MAETVHKWIGLTTDLEGENLQSFVNNSVWSQYEPCTYIVFPNCHNIFLGNSCSTNTLDVVDRYIAHHLSGNIANGTISVGGQTSSISFMKGGLTSSLEHSHGTRRFHFQS